ncbi:MAG TPA: hypothetical protein VK507_19295 [Iamia sp.]|nr:hypothetical protein [Iamia sp.]
MDGGTYIVGSAAVVAVVGALVHGAGAVRRAALPGWAGARAALAQTVIALGLGMGVARLAGSVGLLTGTVVLPAEVGAGLLAGVVARRWARRHPPAAGLGSASSAPDTASGSVSTGLAGAPGAAAGLESASSAGRTAPGVVAGLESAVESDGVGERPAAWAAALAPVAAAARVAVPVGAGSWERSASGMGPAPTAPDAAPTSAAARRPDRAWWEWALAAGPVGVVVAQWVAHTADGIGRGMVHPDTLWYHGPFAARFTQAGGFGALDGVGYEAARWLPFDGQLVHALGLLAFGRDGLSPLVNLGWLVLALLAAWCIGERRRAGPAALAAAAVVLGAPFLAATQPGQASTDIGCAALLLAAVALLLESDLRAPPLAVAGVAAGLALGTKVTIALPLVVLVVAVAALAYVRRGGRPAAWWLGSVAALGVFWFGRSWVLSGSPLPWFTVPGLFDRVTVQGQSPSLLTAHDLDRATWHAIYRPGLHQALGPAWPLVLALAGLGAALAARRGRPAVERIAGLLVLAGVVGHLATPLTAGITFGFNIRYLAPTLLLGAVLAAVAVGPSAAGRLWLGAIATVLVGVGATAEHVERVAAWPGATFEAVVVVLVGGAATAGGVVLVRRRLVDRRALVVAVVLAAVAVGWPLQAVHEDGRYAGAGLPPSDVVVTAVRDVSGERVGLFGSVETYPLFGPDLSNDVEMGSPPPLGPGTPCARWRAHLGGRYDVVVISPYGLLPLAVPPPEVFDGDPAAHLIVRDGVNAAYRLDAPLDPTTCPL